MKSTRYLAAIVWMIIAIGCATNSRVPTVDVDQHTWMKEIIDYQNTLPKQHPDSLQSMFTISDEMRNQVRRNFAHLPREKAARELALWLLEEDGHNMQYQVSANYSPVEAYQNKLGNCLSFTILLSSLASELGIDIHFNEVDLPDIWEFDQRNGLVLYRHVNGVLKNHGKRYVFDLAMEEYDFGFPQRIISAELAAAKLHSNRAIQQLANKNFAAAFHYIQLAISFAPDSGALWVNLGVILKRSKQADKAEQAFLYGMTLNPKDSVAASNLERLYREQGNFSAASKYQALAKKLRQNNPYHYFELAKRQLDSQDLRAAKKSIRKAIKLHDEDPKFYELRSRIAQIQQNYASAFDDLAKAYSLSADAKQKGRYAFKARLINKRALEKEAQRRGIKDKMLEESLKESVYGT